jgi:alpha-ketoglutaric semialdehyde dehydrogenase
VATVDIANVIGSVRLTTNDREFLEDRNPALPDDVVARFPVATKSDAHDAVAAAASAASRWAATPSPRRGDVLRRAADHLEARSNEVAEILCRENGKTLNEARGEVLRGVHVFRYFSGETTQPFGATIPSTNPDTFLFTVQEPIGPVSVITPWNFPLAIPIWKIAPALAFGNTVVFKPSSLAPASGWAVVEALVEAGLPEGVLSFITGSSAELGPIITDSPIKAITFTGSEEVGRQIQGAASVRGAKVQLELGGKNPTVVLDDADLDRAVEITLGAAMRMAGQKCTATSRAIVSQPVFEEFKSKIVERAQSLRVGDPLDSATYLGPLITAEQKQLVLETVAQAVQGGARQLTPGDAGPNEGHFVSPILLDEIDPDASLAQNEIFGPVLVLLPAADDDDAIRISNSVRYGLSASIITNDLTRAMRFVRETQAGVVKVNSESAGIEYQAPFGGMKASSSYTREQGKAAAEFFTQTKTVYVDPQR